MNCKFGYPILCSAAWAANLFQGSGTSFHRSRLAKEVTIPSRFDRRQSTERNAAISYGFVPSYFVTAWLVCSSKHLTNKLSNILLVQVQWRIKTTHCSSFFTMCKMTMTLMVYLLTPHQEISKLNMLLPPRAYSPNHLLEKLLLQYKAVVTTGTKIYLLPSSMILFKNIWICVSKNDGQFFHAKSGISPHRELAWSLVQDLANIQNTDLQHLLHMHITKALDKNHAQQGLSEIFLHKSQINILV